MEIRILGYARAWNVGGQDSTKDFLESIICEQGQKGTSWPCSLAVSKPVWHIALLCVQWKTPDDGQSNWPKHAELYSKNKFEKLVHLVGFITRMFLDSYFYTRFFLLPFSCFSQHWKVRTRFSKYTRARTSCEPVWWESPCSVQKDGQTDVDDEGKSHFPQLLC